jgi:hypothetical protein
MPMNKRNVRSFHKFLYAGQLETVTILKRNPDLNASVVTAYDLFNCRWSRLTKRGQQLDGEDTSNYRRTLHIPRAELDRVGVNYINALDRFIDQENRYWQAESQLTITVKLFQQHICVECFSINPPSNP